ncbi:MAG: hypothetical protein HY646_00225, partial [Acidobacteria bacterium]|nr:hypothetical protein [Acidobacteriota bacterium]
MSARMGFFAGAFGLVVMLSFDHAVVAQGNGQQFKGIGSLFSPVSGVTRDTNGDGHSDSIAARIIVPADATTEDTQAAINLAGRFGFETLAATLPIVMRDNAVPQPASIALPVLVGRQNAFVQTLVERGQLEIKNLKPGQGLVAVVRSPLGGPDGVVVAGGDDEGTLNAANELASRLPRLWSMTGITVSGLEEQVLRQLQSNGIAATEAAVESLVVDSDRRGIATVTVRAHVPPSADSTRALKIFQDVDQAHRRGQEIKTLNFANVASTAVAIYARTEWLGTATVARSGLNSRTLTPPIDPDELAPDSPGDRGRASDAGSAPPGKTFDLSNAYSIEGWYGDSYTDLIPDRTDTGIIVSRGADALSAAHIAARLGLETTGITLPIARTEDKVRDATREPSPILVGRANELTDRLVKIGKARTDDLKPGEGVVQIVPKAFGNATATVIAGADDAGAEAAAQYLARRVPYVWDIQRGAPSFTDLAIQTNKFLQARNAAGQASQAIGELADALRTLKGKTIESVDVKLFLEEANSAFEGFVARQVQEAIKPGALTVSSQGRNEPIPVFEDKLDIPW